MARKTNQHRHRAAGVRRFSIEAYLDTSAFIAFLDKSDSFRALFKRLFAETSRLVTSALVVAEAHGWFLRRYDRHRAMDFLTFLDALPDLAVQPFDVTELSAVRAILASFSDQELTMTDAHGLVIMRDRRSGVCWSTDRHLGLTGVKLAIAT